MAWADDMLGMMQGSPDAGKGIQLAVMTGPRSCKAGNMELAEEDLIIASHLLQRSATGVSMTAPAGGGQCTDRSSYLPALEAGDAVVVCQISEEKYLVLERVVGV
ncbi:MAG: DUF2577 family protein [Lachnospiraceae bacterium]|jgi:hypothetical protein|nr:DUF2577 family protein [Lachnospiraceae bacterium]MCI8960151.1 DUF2577 family protein [Lachnospiraceae bacterium]